MISIKEKLSSQGYRMTKPRQAIFANLDHEPQSVAEISDRLKKQKIKIDKVTIYRTLTQFVKLGIVEETQFKDKISVYELADQEHHHHVICDNCGKIEDICLDEKILVEAAKKNSSFKIKSHHLEFFGLCKKCC